MNENGHGDTNRKHGPFRQPVDGFRTWWEEAEARSLQPSQLAEQASSYDNAFATHASPSNRKRAREIYLSKIGQLKPASQDERTLDAIKSLSYRAALEECPIDVRRQVMDYVSNNETGKF